MAERLKTRLSSLNKDIGDAKILVLGIAFKGQPATDDTRDSPTISLVDHLKEDCGCRRIYGHDFVVPADEIAKAGIEYCSLEDGFKAADAVIFMNNHPGYYDLNMEALTNLMNKPAVFIDDWHIFEPEDVKGLDGIIYGGA